MKKLWLLLCLATIPGWAAKSSSTFQASVDLASQGLGQMVQGSTTLLQDGSPLVVVAVQNVGEMVHLSLKSLHEATVVVVNVSSSVSSVIVGQTIQVVPTAAGVILQASGQDIAFIPDTLANSLIYSTQF